MDEEKLVRFNGQEAIPYIQKDGEFHVLPQSLLLFFEDDLQFLVAMFQEGGEQSGENPDH